MASMQPFFNPNTNMYEINSKFIDLEDPNLFRNIFPYEDVPRLIFNQRIVPMNVPKEIWITDTTFRDGQQSRSPYTVAEISRIYDLLHELDNENGLIKQSEFFIYNQKDKEAVYECRNKGYRFPEITSWIRAKKEDFDIVKSLELKETGILVSCSDYHIFKKLGWDRRKAAKNYKNIISSALEAGIVPRCHFEDITRSDFFGFVIPFTRELMELSKQAGIPIKIRACDTLGLATSIPGVVMPRSVQQIMYGFTQFAGVPSEWLEWHGHNDFYGAVPNATTAWLYGAAAVNCSLLGIGERTGNTPLEAMIFEYLQLRGGTEKFDLTKITEIANVFENELNYEIPPRTPFVGRAFNATRAGIHADGLNKNEEIYNIFDTSKLLGRPPVVIIDSHSGISGIVSWINNNFDLVEEKKIKKNDPRLIPIKEWIDKEYEDGRNTAIGHSEMEKLIKENIPELLSMRQSRVE